MKTLYEEAQAILPHVVDLRRALHARAEGGWDLPQTTALVKHELEALGISYSQPLPSAVVCQIGAGGPNMVLRADMDALHMQEDNDLAFKSQTDYAHCCGHDCHTAMLLGAARLLKAHEKDLPGRVLLVFQPNEEGAVGAQRLLDQGLLKEAWRGGFAIHMDPTGDPGVLYATNGPIFASCDDIIFTVRGKSTHGAMPAGGIDPIFAAVQVYNSLQGLMSREKPNDEAAVFSICMFHAGHMDNLVPDEAEMQGTLRTYDNKLQAHLLQRMDQICAGAAAATGASIDFNNWLSVPAVVNDPALNRAIGQTLAKHLPQDLCRPLAKPFYWSEDFGFFGASMPIVMMTLGAHVAGCRGNLHNADVLFDEGALASGVTVLAAAGLTAAPAKQ